MSLLYIDGFHHQNNNRYQSFASFQSWGSASPRTPGGYWVNINNIGGGFKKLVTASAEVFTGIGYISGQPNTFVAFYGDNGATNHITVYLNPSTFWEIRRGGTGGTLLATGTTAYPGNVWHYVEVRCIVSDTVGVVEVRIDGQTTNEVSFSGDTKNAGTSTNIDSVGFGNVSGTPSANFADWYILNTLGTYNNTWLGDVAVRVLKPSGNGTTTQLTNSAGNQTNNYTYVDEVPASSADYTGAQASGLADTYNLADLPAGVATVYGVQVDATIGKSDANLAQAKIRTRSGGSDFTPNTYTLSTTYQEFRELSEVDPATGLPWTTGSVNGLEAGMETV
jgi:hypothetical protein